MDGLDVGEFEVWVGEIASVGWHGLGGGHCASDAKSTVMPFLCVGIKKD